MALYAICRASGLTIRSSWRARKARSPDARFSALLLRESEEVPLIFASWESSDRLFCVQGKGMKENPQGEDPKATEMIFIFPSGGAEMNFPGEPKLKKC